MGYNPSAMLLCIAVALLATSAFAQTATVDSSSSTGVASVLNCNATYFSSGDDPYFTSETKYLANQLYLYVAVPVSFVQVNFTFARSDSTKCNANSGWAIASDVPANKYGNCTVVMKRQVTWENLHESCGATKSKTSDYVHMKFELHVRSFQDFHEGDGSTEEVIGVMQRTAENILPLVFSFPRYVTASSATTKVTNLLSGNRSPGQAALTSLQVTTNADPLAVTLDFEIQTLVTYPDKIATPTVTGFPTDTSVALKTSSDVSCDSTAGSQCRQSWKYLVTLTALRCDFTGTYTFFFPYDCRDSFASSCPQANMTATFNIKTLYHCALVSTAALDANLKMYKTSSYASNGETSSYRLREYAYGEITTSSSTVTIDATTIKTVTLIQSGADSNIADVVMVNSGSNTAEGDYASCSVTNSNTAIGSTKARFTCRLMAKHIVLPSLAARTVTWRVVVAVTFAHTESASPVTSRRLLTFEYDANTSNSLSSLMDTKGGQAEAVANVKVAPSPADYASYEAAVDAVDTDVTSSAHTVSSSILATFVACLLAIFARLM